MQCPRSGFGLDHCGSFKLFIFSSVSNIWETCKISSFFFGVVFVILSHRICFSLQCRHSFLKACKGNKFNCEAVWKNEEEGCGAKNKWFFSSPHPPHPLSLVLLTHSPLHLIFLLTSCTLICFPACLIFLPEKWKGNTCYVGWICLNPINQTIVAMNVSFKGTFFIKWSFIVWWSPNRHCPPPPPPPPGSYVKSSS